MTTPEMDLYMRSLREVVGAVDRLEVLAANATAVEAWRALGFRARSHVMTKSRP